MFPQIEGPFFGRTLFVVYTGAPCLWKLPSIFEASDTIARLGIWDHNVVHAVLADRSGAFTAERHNTCG